MSFLRLALSAILLVTALVILPPVTAHANPSPPTGHATLSSYWDPDVLRWEDLIVEHAQVENLDPDLVAAIIWKESWGKPHIYDPLSGAIGLMMIMPAEQGLTDRPGAAALMDPDTNLSWGTYILGENLRGRAQGDVYDALRAYNGGWGRYHKRGPTNYAAAVLDLYSRAVAARHGLRPDGPGWVAVFAVRGASTPSTVTVVGPDRPLARYSHHQCLHADIPTAPLNSPPHAAVFTFVDWSGMECTVGLWLQTPDGSLIER